MCGTLQENIFKFDKDTLIVLYWKTDVGAGIKKNVISFEASKTLQFLKLGIANFGLELF